MEEGVAETAAPSGLGSEAVGLLQRLIRIDTVNPPGRERGLQIELAELLADAGFECELLAAEPERPNLIARLPGHDEGPTLALLGHVDTVPADPEEWSRDPWGGEIAEGLVWGRGALDMKGQVAAEAAACVALGRGGWRPAAGRLMLILTVDEEAGGRKGARWLCEEHPEKVRSDFVVNEGGGPAIEFSGRRLYTLCIGEKGVHRLELRARGRAGHASVPRLGENAVLKLAPLLARLSEQPPLEPMPEGLEFLSAVLEEEVSGGDGMESALARLRGESPALAAYLAEPMLGVTMAPTLVRAGEKANVIPSRAEALIDCRTPPGLSESDVRQRVAAILGEGEYQLEFAEAVVGTCSPSDSRLADAIRSWIADADPEAELVPIVMPGFSDSHWFRAAFGAATVYGFCPSRQMNLLEAAPLFHAADERVPVSDVEVAAGFFWDLPQRLLG
jgi:acetylornithine deacetylase/succinyl-diaminopimelate desuccinylase-like protein